jgi:hypothetical protein
VVLVQESSQPAVNMDYSWIQATFLGSNKLTLANSKNTFIPSPRRVKDYFKAKLVGVLKARP